ncbi:MAG: TIGR03936 family radical SAM-associated protein [Chthonomonadales bacterium]
MKVLFTFEKGEEVRWLGHLDILRTFERAIRRSDLPVMFSSGYNPRERLSFASALGVGVTGSRELGLLELSEEVDPDEVADALNRVLPQGIRVLDAKAISDAASRNPWERYQCSELVLVCVRPGGVSSANAGRAIEQILARTSLQVSTETDRGTRTRDIRRFLRWIRPAAIQGDTITFSVGVALGQEGSARPAEIVAALAQGLEGLTLRRAHRAAILTEEECARRATAEKHGAQDELLT